MSLDPSSYASGQKEREWENFYEAWHKEFFFEYLEKDVMAYQELKDLVVGVKLPNDPNNLSLEEGNTLLRMAQSQDDWWEGFTHWFYEQWNKDRLLP